MINGHAVLICATPLTNIRVYDRVYSVASINITWRLSLFCCTNVTVMLFSTVEEFYKESEVAPLDLFQ